MTETTHIVTTVQAIAGYILDTYLPDRRGERVPEAGILADALEERRGNVCHIWLLRQMDQSQPWVPFSGGNCPAGHHHGGHHDPEDTLRELAGRPTRHAEAEAKAAAMAEAKRAEAATARAEAAAAHYAMVAPLVDDLEARAAAAHKARRVGQGYRLRQLAAAIRTPGYVHAAYHDLRGTPPAGHVWIRGATCGRYSTSRRDKFGAPLTSAEVREAVAVREE